MDKSALINELLTRLSRTAKQEDEMNSRVSAAPSWASYFTGYRDALGELIEWLENA